MSNSEVFARKQDLERLISLKDKHLIKVITGIRRCGKSTLMMQFREWLLGRDVRREQVIFINFEDYAFKSLLELDSFYRYVTDRIVGGSKMYLFFDEVQQVENFQKAIDSFYINENLDIYITGSNSTLLSGELATLLSGRYVEIKLLPFSFNEFLRATRQSDLRKGYRQYIETSSFPYVLQLLDTPQNIPGYLDGIYNSILVKDIINRKKIGDIRILASVIDFIFDNIGLEVSPKKIADTLTSGGRKIDSRTLEKLHNGLVRQLCNL